MDKAHGCSSGSIVDLCSLVCYLHRNHLQCIWYKYFFWQVLTVFWNFVQNSSKSAGNTSYERGLKSFFPTMHHWKKEQKSDASIFCSAFTTKDYKSVKMICALLFGSFGGGSERRRFVDGPSRSRDVVKRRARLLVRNKTSLTSQLHCA